MSRRVELRPAAKRDLHRLGKFIARMSPPAAERRINDLMAALANLAHTPFAGRPATARADLRQVVIKIGRARYVARYRVSDDLIEITRLWHSLEDRPR